MRAALALAALSLAAAGCSQQPASDAPAAPIRPAPTEAEKAAILAALPAPWSQGDLENGRRVFARCRSCHTVTEGGPHMTGPNLWGVFGRQAGTAPKYNYSAALKGAGFAWDGEQLDHWLENPQTYLRGTKMSFAGIPDAADRRDVIAWLKVETGYGAAPAAEAPTP